eukprot:m.641283 g.641283  ORF g.641283 m.641283 type:complete len:76 (+) comp22629_c0_seq6:627-854(+)
MRQHRVPPAPTASAMPAVSAALQVDTKTVRALPQTNCPKTIRLVLWVHDVVLNVMSAQMVWEDSDYHRLMNAHTE